MTAEATIMRGLFERVKAFAESKAPQLGVAWPEIGFPPPKDAEGNALPYLRAFLLPANTAAFAIDATGSNDHTGILQVSVFWPKGEGVVKPVDLAGEIASHFRRTTRIDLDGVRIDVAGPPSVGPVLPETDLVQVPVSVPYRSFVQN